MKTIIKSFVNSVALLITISVYALEHPIQANSNHAGGILEFSLAPGHTAINQMTKPLIVVEGFDMGHILKPEQRFGSSSLHDFLDNLSDDGPDATLTSLLDGNNQSYDIVYVNYNNGTDDIERNAKLVEDVIDYVNTNKAAVGGVVQANVVLGISMGGLCSRLALKNMETANQNHQTRLFITWDTPHQGSNMPQGFQHLVRHASDIYISTGLTAGVADMRIPLLMNGLEPRRVFALADEPASKQMLINRVAPDNSIDNTTHDDWQGDLTTLGHPEGFTGTGAFDFDRIAVSNGSECALTQGFDPGDNLIHLQGDAMNVGMLSDIIARLGMPLVGAILNQPSIVFYGGMPGRNKFKVTLNVYSKALNTGNQVYQLKMEYTKKLFNLITINTVLTDRSYNANASTLPYDYYPGGNVNIGEYGIDQQEMNNWFYRYNISASNEPAFCFVPVPSALDIGEGNVTLTHSDYLTPYRGAVPPTGTKSSPFDGFITAFNGSPDNEKHVLIERRNGDWVAGWLNNGQPVPANCSFACDGFSLSGDNYFCGTSSSNYSITNLPNDATVTWDAIPSGVVNINCSTPCQQAYLTRVNPGSVTLSASFTSSCSATPVVAYKSITVGTVYPTDGGTFNDGGSGTNQPLVNTYNDVYNRTVYISLSGNSNEFYWDGFYTSGNVTWYHPVGYDGLVINFGSPAPVYYGDYVGFSVHRTNVCGTASAPLMFQYLGSTQYYMIAPNPASSNFSLVQKDQYKTMQTSKADLSKIEILDKMGNIVVRKNYPSNTKSATVDVLILKSDVYNVRIYSKDNVEVHKLIVQH